MATYLYAIPCSSDFRLQTSDFRREEFKRETNECSPPADEAEDEDEGEDVGQQAVKFVGFEGGSFEAEVLLLFPPKECVVLRKTRYSFPFSENPSGIHLKGPSWKAWKPRGIFHRT